MTENLLKYETSPYLLQHQHNPVHWYPWGDAAFEHAHELNKPIFLSVGYAACHWCHVMAHESFEDPITAEVMNEHFINIKVDREERPDVDKIYMDAIHALGTHGGWPLTMFLTPDGTPFWGGTYFPKVSRYGQPSFQHVLREIARIWRDERDKVENNRVALLQALSSPMENTGGPLTPAKIAEAAHHLVQAMDIQHGGLRGAPKFPQCSLFELLRRHAINANDTAAHHALGITLQHICQGGIYDHLGGGFARYSVDERWLVPHFEKMLYDNAQLIGLLARHHVGASNDLFRFRIDETAGWVLREMLTPEGVFAASYDADSEGVEGKFYVWAEDEIDSLLGADIKDTFKAIYAVTAVGNFEGHNILNRLHHLDLLDDPTEAALVAARQGLFAQRCKRISPAWDDKVLADWNGLMISALAEAGMLLDRPDWITAASTAFDSIITMLWHDERLMHVWRAGQTRNHATADAYANLIAAAINLYEATANHDRVIQAEYLLNALDRDHWDDVKGGYFMASAKAQHLIVRPKFAHDDATPNANAVMISNLAKLYVLTGRGAYLDKANAIHDAFCGIAQRNLLAHATFLASVQDLNDLVQIVIATTASGEAKATALQKAILAHPLPNRLITRIAEPHALPPNHPVHGKQPPLQGANLYLCRGNTCSLPVTDPTEVPAALSLLGLSAAAS